ncbi:MAG: SDR family oxidoreductase [Geobacteraceae bacterium]|nr:SDR family oxidoreductase [Geobacteraceae bacterium]
MNTYDTARNHIRISPKRWLITGVAGFVGSNLLEELLRLDQQVVGLDNFSTGKRENLTEVQALVGERKWQRFQLIEGDIRHLATCRSACKGADIVLHQAALGSVPHSIEDPLYCNDNNVNGTLSIFKAACDEQVNRVVYASSSAVYGDQPDLPKVEDVTGNPLSPYAVSKKVAELYARVFSQLYGLETIGLRYFNVFGPRQDPEGAYAAVIPHWISALCSAETVYINGTGETSRDFCYIDNVVQVNLLAALTRNRQAVNEVYNVAVNGRTSLNNLYYVLRKQLLPHYGHIKDSRPVYREFRTGDVLHSQADISKASQLLGYAPTHSVEEGLEVALWWYMKKLAH